MPQASFLETLPPTIDQVGTHLMGSRGRLRLGSLLRSRMEGDEMAIISNVDTAAPHIPNVSEAKLVFDSLEMLVTNESYPGLIGAAPSPLWSFFTIINRLYNIPAPETSFDAPGIVEENIGERVVQKFLGSPARAKVALWIAGQTDQQRTYTAPQLREELEFGVRLPEIQSTLRQFKGIRLLDQAPYDPLHGGSSFRRLESGLWEAINGLEQTLPPGLLPATH